MLPAVGQAAIGLQARAGDRRMARVCRRLDHRPTRVCAEAERAFLEGFGGGCHSPVAALATVRGGRWTLVVRAFDGERAWRRRATGAMGTARSVGRRLGRAARRALGLAAGLP
jgi:hydroxymethylbilane synthase